MNLSRSPKFTTKSYNRLIAVGPHDTALQERAGTRHYELRQVTKKSRNGAATYELAILSDDELLTKHVLKSMTYGDAVCSGIALFVKEVSRDDDAS